MRSAAAFADVSAALLAVGAPIDLVGRCGRLHRRRGSCTPRPRRGFAAALGGAVALEVDLTPAGPPADRAGRARPAALDGRAESCARSCVGEALTMADA